MTTDYRVSLDAFEGPLDLLLYLIRRAEIDIHDIPIAQIAEQYMAYLGEVDRIDIDLAGEFLVMAATLMEIKSRMLSPRPQRGGAGDGGSGGEGGAVEGGFEVVPDPRAELVRQLLEYKRYRDATDRLEAWRSEWDHRYPAARAVVGKPSAEELAAEAASAAEDERVDVDDLQLIDLVEAFARIVESVDFSRVGEHRVVVDETPVEVHGERIVERLRAARESGGGAVEFKSLFVNRSRSEMIGLFLAILELVKQQRIQVRQEAIQGEIVLDLAPEGAEQPGAEAAAAPADPAGAA